MRPLPSYQVPQKLRAPENMVEQQILRRARLEIPPKSVDNRYLNSVVLRRGGKIMAVYQDEPLAEGQEVEVQVEEGYRIPPSMR